MKFLIASLVSLVASFLFPAFISIEEHYWAWRVAIILYLMFLFFGFMAFCDIFFFIS